MQEVPQVPRTTFSFLPKMTAFPWPPPKLCQHESVNRRRKSSFSEELPYDEVSCEPGFIEVRARKANLMRLVKYIDKMDPYVVFNELWSNTCRQTKVDRDGHKHPHWDIETHNALQTFRFPRVHCKRADCTTKFFAKKKTWK